MNNLTKSKRLVMYVIAKEKYLQALLSDGAITQSDFDNMSKFLHERFGVDDEAADDLDSIRDLLSFPSQDVPANTAPLSDNVNEQISNSKVDSSTFVSLTEAVQQIVDVSPAHIIQNWLRSNNVVEFLGLWECEYNSDFNELCYATILSRKQSGSFTITPKQWIEQTNAIGLISKQGKNGGTYAHPLIACEFMLWLSPEYILEFLQMRSSI